jgi:hypothetical protein
VEAKLQLVEQATDMEIPAGSHNFKPEFVEFKCFCRHLIAFDLEFSFF